MCALLAVSILGGACSREETAKPASSVREAERPPDAARVDAYALPRSRPDWQTADNAARDGWQSEALSAEISARLSEIAKLLESTNLPSARELESWSSEDVRVGELRPNELEIVRSDDRLRVRRPSEAATRRASAPPGLLTQSTHSTARETLAAEIGRLLASPRSCPSRRAHLKLIGLDLAKTPLVLATVRVELLRTDAAGSIETHAEWRTIWRPYGESLLLVSIASVRFEESERIGRSPLFTDITAEVLGSDPAFVEQIALGHNYWLERSQDDRYFVLIDTPALAIGDVDGDGLEDVFVSQGEGRPNRLFVHRADGTAVDRSAAYGLDWLESTRGALLVDLDGDGDRDLAALIRGALVVASNEGGERFETRAVLPTVEDTMSLVAADVDLDRDLDLLVTAYKADDLTQDAGVVSIDATGDFVYHDANNAAGNLLIRNETTRTVSGETSWRFVDATRELGLDENNRRYSFAASFEDFDRDGDPDLYVANDFGRNNLYRNDVLESGARRFVDIAPGTEAEDSASGMAVSWGDVDRDGRLDIHVANMFSAAGRRVTSQAKFQPDATSEARARLARFARGNTLLRQNESGEFTDVSIDAGIEMGRWAWGSLFADLDSDGWEDLLVGNGYVTTEDTGDL